MKIIRFVLWLVTMHRSIYESGKEPIKLPPNIAVFSEIPTSDVLEKLARTYCQVFGESPWCETHAVESVIKKLSREIKEGRLVLMIGEKDREVSGFCWGAIIPASQIPKRVAMARFKENIEEGLQKARGILRFFGAEERILYLDELAVVSEARGGLAPIQFLLRPLLELGWQKGTKKAIFWTSEKSAIRPLSLYMGFKPIYRINDLLFLENPNIVPLLKIAQGYDPKKVAKIMKLTSRMLRANAG